MADLDRALSEVAFIRETLAASTRFRGLAPYAVATSGFFAVATAVLQSIQTAGPTPSSLAFVGVWTAVAAMSLLLIGGEAVVRSKRLHSGIGDLMLAGTLRVLLPFFGAGAAITLIVARISPETIWMLPGLWQIVIALAGFATRATLPPGIVWAASWYLGCGVVVLLAGASSHTVSPWMMGVPFGIGQLLVAAILRRAAGGSHG